MKRYFISLLTAIMAVFAVSCEYDDSALIDRLDDLEGRVQILEQLCNQMNTNISSLQQIVNALQNKDYVKTVTPIAEGDKTIGYTITFEKGEAITLYNGKDGKDGADGEDGYTPVIGVSMDEDGIYYWTLDGKWLTDEDGNKISASAKDGADGKDGVIPELQIKEGYWYVSYDGGENWERLGRATGASGSNGDSFFKSVNTGADYVELILSDGTSIVIPMDPSLDDEDKFRAAVAKGGTVTLEKNITLDKPLEITKDVTINLNGKTLTGSMNVSNKTKLTVNNGTIENTDENVSGIISNGDLTLNNVEIISARHALRIESGNVIINGGTYKVKPISKKTLHALNVGDDNTVANVIIKDGTFIGPNGTMGDSGAAVAVKSGSTVTIEGGDFSGGLTNTLSSKGTLTITGGTFDQNPSTYVAKDYKAVQSGDRWYVVTGTVDAVATTQDTFAAAIANGKTNINLTAGKYIIPKDAKGKTLTINGTGNPKDVTIEVKGAGQGEANGQLDYNLDGSTVTFKGITIKTNGQTYAGYARLKAEYIDCIFDNCYCLNGDSKFDNCIFNQAGDQYNVWTWGAPNANFNKCTFNSDGKAVLLYGQANTRLTIENSVFNDNGGLTDKKAAIEIGNDYNKSYELIVNNTKVNGYEINDKGIYTGTTLWANKNSMGKDKLNVVVDGVDVY